jgi:L-asparaginase / beta-aspartyl-peptidase
MKSIKLTALVGLLLVLLVSCNKQETAEPAAQARAEFSMAIHGGAGAMPKGTYTPEQEAAFHAKLKEAAQLGYEMLSRGDSAVDVVQAVICVLEDSPLFNAGRGSVFTNNGKIKMDAAIMNGSNLDAGSISNVQRIKNPIKVARMVMDSSKYIMFSSAGAERFAEKYNIEKVDVSYFYTQHQYNRWKGMKDSTEGNYIRYVDSVMALQPEPIALGNIIEKYGTVGCVVLDKHGNLAAGTSTGGLMNKKYNRIGDSPVIGAGTYANNKTCAISCTGTGEDFIKTVAAKTVADLIEFKGLSLEAATHEMIHVRFKEITGDGGMIAIDQYGNISFQYNTDGMFRAKVDAKGNIETKIYNE